jgi:hypothetical protein
MLDARVFASRNFFPKCSDSAAVAVFMTDEQLVEHTFAIDEQVVK